MLKQKIFLSSALSLCLGLGVFYTLPAIAVPSLSSYEIAQGDGDPEEAAMVEAENAKAQADENASDLLTDEKEETADDAVATITAEGDFLLPTYLLPVESEQQTEIQTKTAEAAPNDMVEIEKKSVTTTSTKTTTTSHDLPLVVLSQNAPAPAQDIEIDIDTNALTAQAAVPQTPRQIGSGHARATNTATQSNAPVQSRTTKTTVASTKPILIPLTSLPEQPATEPPLPPERVRHVIPSVYADQFLSAVEQGQKPSFIMPQEIKVSFYKNATEFSGQSLKWIKAFTKSALSDPRLVVEVRMSKEDPAVQYKRMAIIRNALRGNGLSPHQIRIVQTNRPADSIVLRTVTKPEDTQIVMAKSATGRKTQKRTINW